MTTRRGPSCDECDAKAERPPESVPVDVDAGIAVAEVLGLVDIANHETTVAEAVDLHAAGFPVRARAWFLDRGHPHATGEDWDAILAVATLVGRRKLEAGAP